MKKYIVEVVETVTYTVAVNAENKADASWRAHDALQEHGEDYIEHSMGQLITKSVKKAK